jgi:Domain of unknown function (DUF4132)
MRWFGTRSQEPALDWAGHEQRAGDLVAELQPYARHSFYMPSDHEIRTPWVHRARQLPPEALASLLLLLIRRAVADDGWSYDTQWRLTELNPRKYTVTDEEAAWVLCASARLPDGYRSNAVLSTAVAIAARARLGSSEELRAALETFSRSVDERRQLATPDRSKLKRRLAILTPRELADDQVDLSVLVPADGWADALLAKFSAWQGPAAGVSKLLCHLATAAGNKPSKTWLAQTGQLVRDPGAVWAVRLMLETLITAQGARRESRWTGILNLLLSNRNSDIARSAAWAAGTIEQPWVVPALQAAADRAIHGNGDTGWVESAKVPNACIYSLGVIGSADAIAALQQLQRTTRNAGFRKQISTALTAAAQRSGLTPSQLVERVVPAAGLDPAGERHIQVTPAATARVRVTEDCRVVTEWNSGDSWATKAPAGASVKEQSALRAAVKDVKDTLAGERYRLESLLADDRQWTAGEWRRLYLDHPVTGPLARRLLWTVQDDGATATGLPASTGMLAALDSDHDIPADAVISLWHPARAATAEVQRWRDRLARDELVQPFKQVYREVYLLTPAERQTRLYSNRFAAHILRYRQTYALMKERHWTTNFLGPHDGGYDGHARREFSDADLTAVFDHYAIDPGDHYGDVDLCSTDRVAFHRTGDRSREPIPLDNIPDLVFTEAMRDIDLFIGVTSIALDPNWADHGNDPHLGYWQHFAFGELTTTAAVRRDALSRIIPKLKIVGQLELGDRFLRVHGRQHTYKIHIGSANIQIEPDNRYLCIVPRSTARPKVMLPFDGDQVLSVIVSKAVLLAADDKITDPTILQQLKRR